MSNVLGMAVCLMRLDCLIVEGEFVVSNYIFKYSQVMSVVRRPSTW
jgi:hypothetical protein